MHWLYLTLAVALETGGTICIKLSDGFSKLAPSVLLFIFYGLSIAAFIFAVKAREKARQEAEAVKAAKKAQAKAEIEAGLAAREKAQLGAEAGLVGAAQVWIKGSQFYD